ncbi:hypothetical protein F750_3838 [Streptomyces sp. PAMC 26508]|nr:hypothetical protein F750_3838 [Streptomyces sp. PAMC 26508]
MVADRAHGAEARGDTAPPHQPTHRRLHRLWTNRRARTRERRRGTCCHDNGAREGVRAAHTGCACAPGKGLATAPWAPSQQNGIFGELRRSAREVVPAPAEPRNPCNPAIVGRPRHTPSDRRYPAIFRSPGNRAFRLRQLARHARRHVPRTVGGPPPGPPERPAAHPSGAAACGPAHPPGAPVRTSALPNPRPCGAQSGRCHHLPDRFAARGDWSGGLPQPAESSSAGRPTQDPSKRLRFGRGRAHGRAHGHTSGARHLRASRRTDNIPAIRRSAP